MLAQQVLADHVAVAAVLPKALRQPFLQPVETPLTLRWSNRCPTARPQITSYRIPAAPPPPPRPAPASSPPTVPTPAESLAPAPFLSFVLLSEGVSFDVARGSVF